MEYIVDVPRDVEADLVAALAALGVQVATVVPAAREPGLVRVSRTGGSTDGFHGTRDRAEVLFEVWAENSVDAFDAAQRVYGAMRVLEHVQELPDGVGFSDLELSPPRSYDDPQAPDLYRVTMTSSFTTDLTTITLDDGRTNGRKN